MRDGPPDPTAGDVLLEQYDRALRRYGDTAAGAHWPNEADRRRRFDVMLDLLPQPRPAHLVLCDFACGTGELLTHLGRRGLTDIRYIGADRSPLAVSYARRKHPTASFVLIDIEAPDAPVAALARAIGARRLVVRADYGLYDYTAYLYRHET